MNNQFSMFKALAVGASLVTSVAMGQTTNRPGVAPLTGPAASTHVPLIVDSVSGETVSPGNAILYGIRTNFTHNLDDTNRIQFWNSEFALANGTYYFVGNSPTRYTNGSGSMLVKRDDQAVDGFAYIITNAAAVSLYGAVAGQLLGGNLASVTHAQFTAIGGQWEIITNNDQGDGSAVLAQFGTNTWSFLGSPAVSTVNSNNAIYVSTTGSDAVWLRGHPELPMKTLNLASLLATNGDTIFVGPGVYLGDSTQKGITNGVTIIGSGIGVTTIQSSKLDLYGGNVLANFTTTVVPSPNAGTNYLYNLKVFSGADALLVNGGYNYYYDCYFASAWDVLSVLGGTNYFYNCYAYSTNVGGSNPTGRGLVINGGTAVMYGGCIEVLGHDTLNTCVDVYNSSGTATLVGTRLISSPGGSAAGRWVNAQSSGVGRSAVTTYGFSVPDRLVASQTVINSNLMGPTSLDGVLQIATNALASWPTAPLTRGGAALVNSNGTVYGLKSAPNGTAWISTNLIW